MKKLLLITWLMVPLADADYQFEIYGEGLGGYREFQYQNYFDVDQVTTWGAKFGGRYYLTPVSGAGAPLSEMAFLSKASYIDGNYAQWDFDSDFNTLTRHAFAGEGHWIVGHFALGIEANRETWKYESRKREELNQYILNVGAYLNDHSTLTLSVSETEWLHEFLSGDTQIYQLNYVNLTEGLFSQKWKVSTRLGYVESEILGEGYLAELSIGWLQNRRFAVTPNIQNTALDVGDVYGLGISIKYFLNESVALNSRWNYSYSEYRRPESTELHSFDWNIGLLYRL